MFDISALTDRHQAVFVEAMLDLNERYPDLASFTLGKDANSTAVYGEAESGMVATVHHKSFPSPLIWHIIFEPWSINFDDSSLFDITQHELCHVIGFNHSDGNPDLGHC